MLTPDDVFMLKLTAWRENRGAGTPGMHSVMNAILNRALKRGQPVYEVCTAPLQFSSISAPGDPETGLWPNAAKAADWQAWQIAGTLAAAAAAGRLVDLTDGATLYYAPRGIQTTRQFRWLDGSMVPFPESWDPARVRPLCSLGGQLFFAEV